MGTSFGRHALSALPHTPISWALLTLREARPNFLGIAQKNGHTPGAAPQQTLHLSMAEQTLLDYLEDDFEAACPRDGPPPACGT